MSNTAILLIHCPDQTGIISTVSEFLFFHNGNIIDIDQHVDIDNKRFFMRAEWEIDGFNIPPENIYTIFMNTIGNRFQMTCQVQFTTKKPRMALFVSKMQHASLDILSRWYSGEWDVEIPLIISNHPDSRPIAEKFGIDFYEFKITAENKAEQEQKEIALLKANNIDFVVLARYMQVISPSFINEFPNQIINIHHSFLPAFPGAKPYHSAFKRGVKIVGATAHYVTEDLDAGPIIAQDIAHITHRDSIDELVRKGRDIEKRVLSQAVWLQIRHRILPFDNRTIIF
jgi:formyltetrahydrofolate deformylase